MEQDASGQVSPAHGEYGNTECLKHHDVCRISDIQHDPCKHQQQCYPDQIEPITTSHEFHSTSPFVSGWLNSASDCARASRAAFPTAHPVHFDRDASSCNTVLCNEVI